MSVYNTDVLVSCGVFFVVLILTYLFISDRRRRANLPPGPWPYPFIGSIPQLRGRDLREVCKKYREKYGDIFTLYAFSRVIIVVNGFENLKHVLARSTFFTVRPHHIPRTINGEGILLSNGERWKSNRRFAIHTLRDFGMGKSQLQEKIHEEIFYLLEAIEHHNGRAFDITDSVNIAVSNVICSIVFGKRFDYQDEDFLDYLRSLSEITRVNVNFTHRWLQHIPGDPFKVARRHVLHKKLETFYTTKVREHLDDFDEDNERDLIDVYINLMYKDSNEETAAMDEVELVRIVHDLFLAGSETTTTALRFGFACLINHTESQAKMYDELRDVLPANRLANLNDKSKLPYTEATILEILRRASILPFSLPHGVSVDTEYRGYTIPKDAWILPNLDSALLDDTVWENPLCFNPGRFLNKKKSVSKPDEFIPFSLGPRTCLGEGLARMELLLFLSALLQHFEFLPPEGESPPTIATKFGMVASIMPYRLRAIKRV